MSEGGPAHMSSQVVGVRSTELLDKVKQIEKGLAVAEKNIREMINDEKM